MEISYVCCELINWWGWEGDNMELRSDNQGNSKQGITSCVEHGGASILLWQFDDCIDVHTILGKHWDDLKDLWNCQDSEWSNRLTIDPERWCFMSSASWEMRIENWDAKSCKVFILLQCQKCRCLNKHCSNQNQWDWLKEGGCTGIPWWKIRIFVVQRIVYQGYSSTKDTSKP